MKIFINKDGFVESPFITDATIPVILPQEIAEKTLRLPDGKAGKYDESSKTVILVDDPTDRGIRGARKTLCFDIIDNRSTLWFNQLTDAQKSELDAGYKAWLDAPKTKVIPLTPNGLK